MTNPSDEVRARQLKALDSLLFQDRGWFLIDGDNRAVAGVVVVSLEHGLSFVGGPTVSAGELRRATLVGCLHPAVDAVDVDVDGVRGDAIVEQFSGWCAARDLWCLVRPSGGAAGRAHVIIVSGEHRTELEAFAVSLRRQYRLPGTAIDLRGGGRPGKALRPLSAPHRTGVQTRPDGRLDHLLAGLRAALPSVSPPPRQRGARRPRPRRGSVQGQRSGATRDVPRGASGRVPPRRALPAGWAAHLQSGSPPRAAPRTGPRWSCWPPAR